MDINTLLVLLAASCGGQTVCTIDTIDTNYIITISHPSPWEGVQNCLVIDKDGKVKQFKPTLPMGKRYKCLLPQPPKGD